MKTCSGFVRARNEARAWKRCDGRPLRGDKLCSKHRDGLNAALLVLLELDPREWAEEGGARNSSPCVGHAKGRGGKSRRPCGSNRTRHERVPLPNANEIGHEIANEDASLQEGASLEQTQSAETETGARSGQ